MHHATDSTYHGLFYTNHGEVAETRNGSTMKDRSNNPLSHEQMFYHRATFCCFVGRSTNEIGIFILYVLTHFEFLDYL